jgi:hypothetical protein
MRWVFAAISAATFWTAPQVFAAGIQVDTKKILLLNAYPDTARVLRSEMGSALRVSKNKRIPVTRKKELLLKSVANARDAMSGLEMDKGFLADVETHLRLLEKAVKKADFKTAAEIVGTYDEALQTYVFTGDE